VDMGRRCDVTPSSNPKRKARAYEAMSVSKLRQCLSLREFTMLRSSDISGGWCREKAALAYGITRMRERN
jgi:hypothetical protein